MCHQTVSLIARHLEANGIPTLCLVSARDIIEAGRPPRAVFVDYPLGHTAGRPFDRTNQLAILSDALVAFDTMQPGQLLKSLNYQWSEAGWQQSAMNPSAGDTRQAREITPQWQHDADRVAAEQSTATHNHSER